MEEFIVVIKGNYNKTKCERVVKKMRHMGYNNPVNDPLKKSNRFKYFNTCFRASHTGKIYSSDATYYFDNYKDARFIFYDEFIKSMLMETE